MKTPTQCVLWQRPETILQVKQKDQFQHLETFTDESHLWRHLLKCRECDQKYFFEFREEIDWVDGNDPQYSTYIPVETEKEIYELKRSDSFGLLNYYPRLHIDWPKEAKARSVKWVE